VHGDMGIVNGKEMFSIYRHSLPSIYCLEFIQQAGFIFRNLGIQLPRCHKEDGQEKPSINLKKRICHVMSVPSNITGKESQTPH